MEIFLIEHLMYVMYQVTLTHIRFRDFLKMIGIMKQSK
ncbi:hypothetical protein RU87_GL001148 [Lactococcus plantarum]|uniref:Uncharacterized protein n=1 Tax=Pseudolactococcus plantarum TaxID=1365 RepID=A0A2A5S0W7_9LACT|nr:hypothetical protein RU87_GL001148 [Lactococcus plantarum]